MRIRWAFWVYSFSLGLSLSAWGAETSKLTPTQQKIVQLTQLQIDAYNSATTYALRLSLPLDSELKTRLPQILESESIHIVKKKNPKLLKVWQHLYVLMQNTNTTLSADKVEQIYQLLNQFDDEINQEINQIASQEPINHQISSARIVKSYNALSLLVIRYLTLKGDSNTAQPQLTALTQQLTQLDNQVTEANASSEIKEALKKWPVLREALTKNQERDTSFMINRYHAQISEHLMKAYQELQEPKS